ncbi:MAG: hypothetical protein R2873_35105 [Caldilineaceae bacterium]
MTNNLNAPLGVCVLPSPRPNAARTVSYPHYVHEILRHAGLCYDDVDFADLPARLGDLRVLVTVGDAPLGDDLRAQITAWVEDGGRWLSVGGVNGADDLFGVRAEAPAYGSFGGGASTLGEGYLQTGAAHPVTGHLVDPLHYFNGIPVQAVDAQIIAAVLDAHQRSSRRVAVTEKRNGQGRTILVAVDIPGTVVYIQQGRGVLRDGVSAPDGTAPVGDSVLKSSDGAVLDWIFDRQPVPGVPELRIFTQPIADQWRELLLRAIFYLAEDASIRLPLLWLYPHNLPALAHLSHDTDQNDPAKAEKLLDVVAETGIHSTWCVILPGYADALIQRIRDEGHELAMHYDAMTEGLPWNADLFHEQWTALTAMFDGEEPVTNKNHYLRWEGDTDIWQWCLAHGIQLDQSKGASKTGEAGFNFGTCHLHFPVDFDGNLIDVLELPTPTQDFIVFAPPAILEPLLDGVLRSHGVLHLLFHPSHILTDGVADAIRHAVKTAQSRGLVWWTAAQLNRWERARRQVRWAEYTQSGHGDAVTLHVDAPLPGATILWLGDGDTAQVNGADVATQTVTRWGCTFQAVEMAEEIGDWRLEIRYKLTM